MSTAQKPGQATSGFHLITIPFADVAATIPTRPSNTPTSRAGAGNNLHADETLCCTASFNTHHHSAAELAAALRLPSSSPNPHFSPHDHHHHTDIASNITTTSTDIDHPAFAFSTWLAPLIAPGGSSNQGCSSSAIVVRLPHAFVADVLLPAHSRWLRTSALPDSLVAALLDDWPGVRDEIERAVAVAASASAAAASAAADGGGGAGGGAFVRLDACSTKDSALHDAKAPVRSAREVVRAVAGSMRAAGALGRWLEAGGAGGSRAAVALCVVPWDARMDAGNEFRVFVPPPATVRRGERQEAAAAAAAEGFDDGELRISAISQYRWCEPLRLQEGLGMDVVGMVEEGAERLLRKILEVAGWLEWRDKEGKGMLEVLRERGFVFDVAVMPQNDGGHAVQLVELNPFGATTGCGSVLFHWTNDARVLYGLDRREFRVALDR
ncbi:uncharacterized protein LTHEOB_5622 [Lasiodiplodia theobromae]|uniref:uncharacterized protein n=1 Tax=Lasiodiplodia theobromae TaxID=45133 RepID=UPI0015C2F76D|nr:uncharacterized protein LTHEOB_5622 [Lasiodiplodia theobromae]KAF4545211.1 hypothetical protein LTHEOB_5622 [Lasiodiplodia theobromae]